MSCAVCGCTTTEVVCWACCPRADWDEDTADLITAEDLMWVGDETAPAIETKQEKAA